MSDLRIPQDMWEDDDKTGSIVLWLYPDGAAVKEGDIVAEVLVEKVSFELLASASGLLRIKVEPEIPIAKGELVAIIEPQ
jgi:pyruvate/2-oxoglutarate dehydrogenase complex dihydrolipoamide acyltransferase (E2) component